MFNDYSVYIKCCFLYHVHTSCFCYLVILNRYETVFSCKVPDEEQVAHTYIFCTSRFFSFSLLSFSDEDINPWLHNNSRLHSFGLGHQGEITCLCPPWGCCLGISLQIKNNKVLVHVVLSVKLCFCSWVRVSNDCSTSAQNHRFYIICNYKRVSSHIMGTTQRNVETVEQLLFLLCRFLLYAGFMLTNN